MESVLGAIGDMAVRLVDDIYGPGKSLIGTLCFILGIWLNGSSLLKWWKGSQEGFRGNNSGGAVIAKTIVGTLLIYVGDTMGAFSGSMFGETVVSRSVSLDFPGNAAIAQQAKGIIGAAFKVCELFGWAYFARGLWIMQEAAEGNHQASSGSAWVHMIFGAAAAKLPAVIGGVQNSLGASFFTIT